MNRFIHRLAEEDLVGAVRFYKSKAGIGLARRFLAEFERVAKLLEQHPGLGTPTADGTKVHPLTDFPYSIKSVLNPGSTSTIQTEAQLRALIGAPAELTRAKIAAFQLARLRA